MSDPILRVRASGYGGSGYNIPTRNSDGTVRTDPKAKTLKVPGVTTVLGAIEKPGLRQWAVDQTVAFAIANQELLAEREDDWGFRYLRFYHNRKPDYDNPETDLHNYHEGVLDDLSNTGTIIHEAIEAFVKDDPFLFPTFTRVEQEEAFEAFLDWVDENDVEFEDSEVTVFNPEEGYAGTLDLIVKLDGKRYVVDIKSSKKVYGGHISQVVALAEANRMMVPEIVGTVDSFEYKDLFWTEKEVPKSEGLAVLQVRPPTVNEYGDFIPAFCKFHDLGSDVRDAGFEQFLGALHVRKGQSVLKKKIKELGLD